MVLVEGLNGFKHRETVFLNGVDANLLKDVVLGLDTAGGLINICLDGALDHVLSLFLDRHVPKGLVEGVPECMATFDDPIKEKVLKIYILRSVCSWCSSDELFEMGKYTLSLIDQLESEGIRCEVICSISSRSGYYRHITHIPIKKAHEFLDIHGMAFPIAHTAFFRRLWFSSAERTNEFIKNKFGFHSSGGYGTDAGIDVNDGILLSFESGLDNLKKQIKKIFKMEKTDD